MKISINDTLIGKKKLIELLFGEPFWYENKIYQKINPGSLYFEQTADEVLAINLMNGEVTIFNPHTFVYIAKVKVVADV